MPMQVYKIKVKDQNGTRIITVRADSRESARQKVLDMEPAAYRGKR